MRGRYWLAAACVAVLAACHERKAVPDGTLIIDETIELSRQQATDTAARTFAIDDDSFVVAIADEQLTDIRLKIEATDEDGRALGPIEVENHLGGSGLEIAALSVPEGARVTITLAGTPDTVTPGKVAIRARLFSAAAESRSEFAAFISAARAWSEATRSSLRAGTFKASGLVSIDRAIAELESSQGDAAMAAEARLIRANLLNFYKLDLRESRAEAQRASRAFAGLPVPDAHNAARARYIETLSLIEMTFDGEAVDPTPQQADELARASLEALSSEPALGPIEQARALGTRANLDLNMMRLEEAASGFEQARDRYREAGHLAGARSMRFSLPLVLVQQGRFTEAATAFDPLLPEIDSITDVDLRTYTYLNAGRAQAMSNRIDEGLSLLLRGLALSREYQQKTYEAVLLLNLGFIYRNTGDFQQAIAFYDEALKITSAQKDKSEYAFALQHAASVARASGSLDSALKLATESIRASSVPITLARNHHELAMYYRLTGDLPAAIAEYREGLAVDLGDPHHHAHSDGRMQLASTLMDLPDVSAKDRAEAVKLIDEAVAISVAVKDVNREIQARRIRGQINLELGDTRAALADFNKTLQLAQDWRSRSTNSEVRSSMLEDEQFAFRGLLDIALANVARRPAGELRPATPGELAALLRLERARQRSFGALRVGELDAATTVRVDQLLQQMAEKSVSISALLNHDLNAADTEDLHALQLDMSRLHAELHNIRSSAAARNEQVTESSPVTAQGWRALPPGAAQLSYALGEQHVYVLVRAGGNTHLTRLASSREALERQLAVLSGLDARTAPREFATALEAASGALLPAGILPADSSSLYIVAEGRIASVPFAALRSSTDPTRRLIETHDIVMVTTLLGVDEAPRPGGSRPFRFVALASGFGTWRSASRMDPAPRLQAATKEIAVAAGMFTASDPKAKIRLFSGNDGNAAALRDIWSSGADVVHFATHAQADLRQPVASLLVLPATDSGGKATYLTAGQVQSWRGDSELVFLSACESAVGPPQYAAGMPGLQRAFLRAGARGVIATLAPIEDVLAQQFSADFYRRYTSGVPAARALAETQRTWLQPTPGVDATEQSRRKTTALAHGYYTH